MFTNLLKVSENAKTRSPFRVRKLESEKFAENGEKKNLSVSSSRGFFAVVCAIILDI
jgi:hypothetical protein